MLDTLIQKWQQHFGPSYPEVIIRSPGRVNIIGEHTDYNQGFVLPGATSQSQYVMVGKSSDHHWIASDLGEEIQGETPLPSWAKYIHGAITSYAPDIGSLHILIGGDLPIGAGMSSSSALVCGVLLALKELTKRKETGEQLAAIASQVEREVIGVQGGIMDQYAILLSKKDHVMLLDCRTKEYQHFKVDLAGGRWMLINTKVQHNLIDTNYNQRSNECRQAVDLIRKKFPSVESLRDVTPGMLEEMQLPQTLSNRARFVIEENNRVPEMQKAIETHDPQAAGQLLNASHEGLRKLYEVSCPELDHLADFANKYNGVYGARMMGGGFGGCVLCLIKEEAIRDFEEGCADSYQNEFGFSPDFIHFELSKGALLVDQD